MKEVNERIGKQVHNTSWDTMWECMRGDAKKIGIFFNFIEIINNFVEKWVLRCTLWPVELIMIGMLNKNDLVKTCDCIIQLWIRRKKCCYF